MYSNFDDEIHGESNSRWADVGFYAFLIMVAVGVFAIIDYHVFGGRLIDSFINSFA